MFRGIQQERDGFIWQPYVDLGLTVWDDEEAPIRSVTLGMGVWNSFQSKKTLARDSGPSNLYETDFYPSLTVGLPGNFETSLIYYVYTGPNGSFDTVQEMDFLVAYDDSELLGRLAMAPTVTFAVETEGTSFGDRRGSFAGVGLEPTLWASDNENCPLSISVPLAVGLSIDNYYEEPGRSNDTFGYAQAGLTVGMDLPFVPEEAGTWNLSVTGNGYYLGQSLRRANSDDKFQPQVIGSLNIFVLRALSGGGRSDGSPRPQPPGVGQQPCRPGPACPDAIPDPMADRGPTTGDDFVAGRVPGRSADRSLNTRSAMSTEPRDAGGKSWGRDDPLGADHAEHAPRGERPPLQLSTACRRGGRSCARRCVRPARRADWRCR
jgi:hypothetical protein